MSHASPKAFAAAQIAEALDVGWGQSRTGASHDQVWISGLLLLQQRTDLAAPPLTEQVCQLLT